MAVSILIVEGNFLGAELLSSALKRCQNNFDVVGQATSFADATRKLQELRPRVTVTGMRLQEGQTSGYKLISHIREHWPRTLTVALLNDSRQEDVLEAFRCGARGVISRDQPFRVLAKCIRKVHEGEIWASSAQLGYVFESLKKDPESAALMAPQTAFAGLTPRESDVAALVIEGLRNAEIAARL